VDVQGFTLFGLSWGALTHGHGYDLASQTPYLDGTLRWGFDWLMKVSSCPALIQWGPTWDLMNTGKSELNLVSRHILKTTSSMFRSARLTWTTPTGQPCLTSPVVTP